MAQVRFSSITAAVKMSKEAGAAYPLATQTTLRVASALAKRLGAKLRIVTVFEPNDAPPWGDFPMPEEVTISSTDIWQALRRGKEAAKRHLTEEVTKMAGGLRDAQAVGVVVEAFEAADGIIADATCNGADLIVVGISKRDYEHAFRGFSTALSLMSSSPVPVLVVPEEAAFSFEGSALKLLVADDLKQGSKSVLRHSLSLMAQLMPCEVVHLHALEKSLWEYLTKVDAKVVLDACASEMRRRSETFVSVLQPGSTYVVDAQEGDVGVTLTRTIEKLNPDLIAFGRHKALSTRPLMIGRMTANAMLQLRRPIMVVPQDK